MDINTLTSSPLGGGERRHQLNSTNNKVSDMCSASVSRAWRDFHPAKLIKTKSLMMCLLSRYSAYARAERHHDLKSRTLLNTNILVTHAEVKSGSVTSKLMLQTLKRLSIVQRRDLSA